MPCHSQPIVGSTCPSSRPSFFIGETQRISWGLGQKVAEGSCPIPEYRFGRKEFLMGLGVTGFTLEYVVPNTVYTSLS